MTALDRRHLLKLAGGCLGASALAAGAAALARDEHAALAGALAAIADDAIKASAAPGLQLAVWQAQQPVASVVRGFANLETGTPVTAETIFRAGSLTKQFTAALVARLQEQGRLSVDDRLDRHLAFFRGKPVPTLLELIHHTAGIHDEAEAGITLAPLSQIDLARRIAKQATLYDFPPGSAWLYSNANYVLLGAVVESVTGLPLAVAAQRLIFDTLGLNDTRFDRDAEVVKGRASGYSRAESGSAAFANAEYLPIEQAGGAGAIRSTARELCRWHQALFAGRLLSPASIAAITTPARLRDGRPVTRGRFNPDDQHMGETSYGYGLLLDRSTKDGSLIAMHNGFVNGFSAYLATHVPSGLTVACMCNADAGPALPFRALRHTVFADLFA